MLKIKTANDPNKLQSAQKELNKIQVVDKNLQESNIEILRDYPGEFEIVGKLSIGDQITETHSIFRFITDYESYFNAIDQDYESEDTIFNGYVYKINTSQIS